MVDMHAGTAVWAQLQHAAGAADDVPDALECLEGDDLEAREEAAAWLIDTCLYDESGAYHVHTASIPVLEALAAFVDAEAADDAAEELQADVADELSAFVSWCTGAGSALSADTRARIDAQLVRFPWLQP